MADPSITNDLKRVAKWAAVLGAVLGLLCPVLPHNYQAPCVAARAIVNVCAP